MAPYSSNFRAEDAGSEIERVHDSVLSHSGGIPSISTMAVTVCPAISLVSTVIAGVPCPLVIFPADTFHLYFRLQFGSPPATFALMVRGSPCFGVLSGS